jgi:hypothetical protein
MWFLLARLGFKAHPHMLRHACGFAPANEGHDTRALQGLSRPSKYPAYGALHGIGAGSVQGLLAIGQGRVGARTENRPT